MNPPEHITVSHDDPRADPNTGPIADGPCADLNQAESAHSLAHALAEFAHTLVSICIKN